ncbi:MAG: hypothetical protein HC808_15055 [Candidatus Competibacteraceae bacterium]|nr:hypothetical protein [Candidatus Competibacteraceae bacterium]
MKLTLNQAKTRIVDFERGFRFLGVRFVNSLVMQCRYPETETTDIDKNLPVASAESVDVREAPTTDLTLNSPSALTLALREALEDQLPEELLPETPALPANTDEREPSAGNAPHLQTLYLTEHGCVLGKESERLIVRKDGQFAGDPGTQG